MLLVWLLYSHTELKVRIQHPSLKMININYNERIYERNYIFLRWWKTSNDVIAVENAEIGNSPWRGEVLPQFYPEGRRIHEHTQAISLHRVEASRTSIKQL